MGSAENLARRAKMKRLLKGAVIFPRSDHSSRLHSLENPSLTGKGGCQIVGWIETRGRLRQTGEKSGFGRGKIGRGFAKVVLARSCNAHAQFPVIKAVEVFSKDAVFAPLSLDMESKPCFLDFLKRRARPGFHKLGKLLGDGGCAREGAVSPQGIPRSASDGQWIDTMVMKKTGIFRCDRCIDEMGGYRIQRCDLLIPGLVHKEKTQGDFMPIEKFHTRARRISQSIRQRGKAKKQKRSKD